MKNIQGLASDIVMEKAEGGKFAPKAFYNSGYGGGGGYYGGSQDSGGKWPHSLSAPGSGIFLNHHAIRQGARVAMQESPQGRAIVERKVDTVVHTGLKYEPTPDAEILGITQEQATDWARNTGNRFDLYARDKKQHRSETMSLYQFQWLYSYFQERDNDIFVRLYYSPDKSLQNPLQFESIDADQVRGHSYTISYGFQSDKGDGIIRDERGRETGYKIWVKQKDGTYKDVEIPKKGTKSGRIFMLHGFRQEYAGQGRGFSKLAPILQELENLTDFTLAHIKQAINQALITAWVKPSNDEDTKNIFDNQMTNAGIGPAGDNFSNEEGSDCSDKSLINGDFNCYRVPEATFDNPGIFIQELTKGADIKLASPNSPSAQYEKFTDSFESSLSAVSGTPIEVVKMKFGNSFSASRATLLLFWRTVEIARQEMVTDFLGPFVEMWMSGEIAAGRISAPGWSDPRLKAAWMKASWRGAAVPDIDPGKLAKARKDNLEMGISNVERDSILHSGIPAVDNIGINNASYTEYQVLPWSKSAEADTDTDSEEKEDKED
jgi:capsid protein